ncbi:unnamed protein product [Larinioides sclopetarius]|uniref:Mab-21-like HhH/H2TH-like domain-containing protein n=1 Tax=Larinioides sclopetarius TaxID=280406 RepID=A0AAV2AQG8_9ARAC
MNYNTLHSLQRMAAMKIALGIFYDSEIEKMLLEERKYPRGCFAVKFNRDRHELWKLIRIKAAEKLPCLPALLQTTMFDYIQSFHMEAEDWIRDHKRLLNLDPLHCRLACKSNFCWKSDGTINRVETAMKITQNENIDPNTRFILACTYFLEDEVLAIWYGDKEVSKKSLRRKGTNSAVRFWMKWLRKGSVMPWRLMIDDYFSVPCFRRLDIPLRFSGFLHYLSPDIRTSYYEHLQKDEFFSCLNGMDEAERTKLLQLIPQSALRHCLKWPFQTLFVKTVIQLESHGTVIDFEVIFFKILYNIISELRDFDYAQLLKELWDLSPSFKEEIEESRLFSEVMDAILNYDVDSQSLPLVEVLDNCIHAR